MAVVIREIEETVAELYDGDGNHVGQITSEMQLNDVRIQIKTLGLSGYSILWKGYHHININENGYLDEWPVGFFDVSICQLEELL